MAEKPEQLPEWATAPEADVVEPPAAKKAKGWVQGEKPPAGYFNWIFRLLGTWIAWLSWLGDEIKQKAGGGISVPGGIDVDRGPAADGPGISARGYEPDAPGGRFYGSAPIKAVKDDYGDFPAVHAEVKLIGTGFSATYTGSEIPRRGLYHIGATYEPYLPRSGDFYRSLDDGLYFSRDGKWTPILLPAAQTARVVVGDPGAPELGEGWEVLPTSVHEAPAFYFDGRRVWLSGYVRRNGFAAKTMFTLPAGRRPGRTVGFFGTTNRSEVWISISETGEVQTENVLENDVPVLFDVSLHGLSFEVAS